MIARPGAHPQPLEQTLPGKHDHFGLGLGHDRVRIWLENIVSDQTPADRLQGSDRAVLVVNTQRLQELDETLAADAPVRLVLQVAVERLVNPLDALRRRVLGDQGRYRVLGELVRTPIEKSTQAGLQPR